MLDVKNLTISIADSYYTNNLSFSLQKGDKLAIIGEEGNGKSTILKIIARPEEVVSYATFSGTINTFNNKIGYFEQFLDSGWNGKSTLSFFMRDKPEAEDDFSKLDQLYLIKKYFNEFCLDTNILDLSDIGVLSGGEKVKLRLIKLLVASPDILLLDEPTNDLDLPSLVWLENFIKNEKRPIIFISHDETLLENCATAILHIERLKKKTECFAHFEHLGYAEYKQKRFENFERQKELAKKDKEKRIERQKKLLKIMQSVEHDLRTISRRDPSGGRLLKKKMKSVKSQERRYQKEDEQKILPPSQEEAIYLNFSSEKSPAKKLISLSIQNLSAGDKQLSHDINLEVFYGQKVVLVGENGCGKTTLLKRVYQELLRTKHNVGYMPQDYEDGLKGYKSVKDFCFQTAFSKDEQTRLLTILGSMKFTSAEMDKDIYQLSGGQKAKLYLAQLMSRDLDILLLDEPTRNLSPLSCPVVRQALTSFGGAVLCVSHDRKLIDAFDRVLVLSKEGLSEI